MNLIRFLRDEAPHALRVVLIMSTISGVAGGALVALINTAASVTGSDQPPMQGQERMVVLFALALAILLSTKRYSIMHSTEIVEEMLKELQVRICDKIRRSELATMESIDQNVTITSVTQNTRTISQSVFAFSNACQQAFMLFFGLVYLAWLSPPAVVLFLIVAAGAAYYYLRQMDDVHESLSKNTRKGAEFYAYLTHLLYGFKELKLNSRKNEDLYRDLVAVSEETQVFATQSNAALIRAIMVGDLAFYLLAGTIVFILPQLFPTHSEVLVKATIAVMYTIGPLGAVVGSAPQVSNAEVALESLYQLEQRLDDALKSDEHQPTDETFTGFREIVLHNLAFSYFYKDGTPTFSVGPFDLTIQQQEILFIVGGNGSGKSTLLKLITGLYRQQSGNLVVDGRSVTSHNRAAFRELFAGVFADFHLFPRLYGIPEIDEQRVRELLKQLEIEDKVSVVDGRFSTLELSTGQRKRVALLASLLEDREVYVFDEWTADQDPYFRERFYHSVLPQLRERGKTIIAITHDDRYWSAADRVVKLDYGKIIED